MDTAPRSVRSGGGLSMEGHEADTILRIDRAVGGSTGGCQAHESANWRIKLSPTDAGPNHDLFRHHHLDLMLAFIVSQRNRRIINRLPIQRHPKALCTWLPDKRSVVRGFFVAITYLIIAPAFRNPRREPQSIGFQ